MTSSMPSGSSFTTEATITRAEAADGTGQQGLGVMHQVGIGLQFIFPAPRRRA
jgi:hypothetical protein